LRGTAATQTGRKLARDRRYYSASGGGTVPLIGLDTNVLIRLLTGDDPVAQATARAFIQRSCSADVPAYVNRIVLVETVWVLESTYAYTHRQVAEAIDALLRTSTIETEQSDSVWSALRAYRQGADFADAMIADVNVRAGCSKTMTFDRKAAKRIPHFASL
jgi:predicted nucleic-acid-binding protein